MDPERLRLAMNLERSRLAILAELRSYDRDRLEGGDPAVLKAAEDAGLEALRPYVRACVQEVLDLLLEEGEG